MDKPMEHLKQWHILYQGILMPNEVAVYIHLFMLANQRYWPEWIEIADWQLALSTNINARGIPSIINSLVQRGLLECDRGKGKKKSGYKIIPFTKDNVPLPNYTKNDIIKPKYNRNKTEIKPKYNRNITEIKPKLAENSPCESKDGEASKTQHNIDTTQHNILAAAARANDDVTKNNNNNISEIVALFENCIHPVSNEVERDELMDMIETDGYERVKDAIKEAARSRAQSVRYIQAILNRWRKEGQHGRSTGRGSRANQSADQEKRKWESEPNGWRQDLAI